MCLTDVVGIWFSKLGIRTALHRIVRSEPLRVMPVIQRRTAWEIWRCVREITAETADFVKNSVQPNEIYSEQEKLS